MIVLCEFYKIPCSHAPPSTFWEIKRRRENRKHWTLNTVACALVSKKEDYRVLGSSMQFSHSVVSDSFQPHEPQHARPPCPFTNSQSLPKRMSIESVMLSNHLILCRPLLLPPSIFPSIRIFYNKSALHIRWPKYWHFGFSISPSNEYPGLIHFRMDWLDLPELVKHNSKWDLWAGCWSANCLFYLLQIAPKCKSTTSAHATFCLSDIFN